MLTNTPLPPLTFTPLLKRIRWGGRKLQTLLGRNLGPESDYAESWEIADHADGTSCVADGPLAGTSLPELLQRYPGELLGKHQHLTQFPLLVKFLDANDWLSLQVHPNDQQAKTWNPVENGKTEAWIILHAEPGARICSGLQPGVTSEMLQQALGGCDLEELLHIYEVHTGDCIFVPAGTVHALGPGIVLAEIQQQSNLTFRLHDWGRTDASGKPRPVHIAESIACTNFQQGPVSPVIPHSRCDDDHAFEELVSCSCFQIHRHQSDRPFSIPRDSRFHILISLAGHARLETATGNASLSFGRTMLLPACSGGARIIPETDITLLDVTCPVN
ncbi:MAG: putative mannose-6-phosphate isomerase GmuF [Planctomycetota bacterium]|jgi:mannose-6-phosphate isomerase